MRIMRGAICLSFAVGFGCFSLLRAQEPAVSAGDGTEGTEPGVRPLDHQSALLPVSLSIGFRKLYTLQRPHEGQGFQWLEFSPSAKLLAASRIGANYPCDVAVWDMPQRKLLHVLPHNPDTHNEHMINAMAFLPPGDRLVTGCTRLNQVFLWDVQTGKRLDTINTGGRASFGITGLAAFPDGKRVVVCVTSGLIVWDIQTKTKTSLSMDEHVPRARDEPRAVPRYCDYVSFNAEGTQFATLVKDATFFLPRLLVWDAKTCRVIRTIPIPQGSRHMAFSPDGRSLSADYSHLPENGGRRERWLGVWDATTGRRVFAAKVFDVLVESVVFTRDSKYLLAVGRHGTGEINFSEDYHLQLGVWDVANGKLVNRLEDAGTSSPMIISISPDNKFLAVPYWGNIDVYAIEYANPPAAKAE